MPHGESSHFCPPQASRSTCVRGDVERERAQRPGSRRPRTRSPRARHASPKPVRGRPRSRWRIRPTTATSTRVPGSSSAANSAILVEQAVARRHGAHVEPARPRRRHPGIDVRRKLEVGDDDDVAGAERQPPRGEVDPGPGVHRQRDRPRRRRRSARRRSARQRVEHGELLLVREPVRRRTLARELVLRAERALGERAGAARRSGRPPRRPRPRETPRAAADRRRTMHAQVRADGGASMAPLFAACRGSSASRSASPSRLKPSTAAPIASPGATDVHGALRS